MKRVKNTLIEVANYLGQDIESGSYYTIPSTDEARWASDDSILLAISAGELVVNDGNNDLNGLNNQIDFLKNDIPKRVLQTVGNSASDYSLRMRGGYFVAAMNAITDYDFEFDQQLALRGGNIFSINSCPGDFVKVFLIDKNNVLGYGGTPEDPTFLVEYVPHLQIYKGIGNEIADVDVSNPIMAGLFMRIQYHSHANATEAAHVQFNLFAYEIG